MSWFPLLTFGVGFLLGMVAGYGSRVISKAQARRIEKQLADLERRQAELLKLIGGAP
mgnify:CR=1 FL=1